MADIFQGAPNPATVTTSTDAVSAPEFYTNYLQDVANLGQAGVQQSGVAGFSPLQAQALSLAPDVAFAGSGSAGTGQQYLTAAGATPATSLVNQYMDPYMQNVVSEMGRLQQRNIAENVLPSLRAGLASSGNFGSQRESQITSQILRDLQSDLVGRQYTALSEGYKGALQGAQNDLTRQLQSGQALGNLGQIQQGMGTTGLDTLFKLGQQEQALGQKVLDQPMTNAQNFSKLLQGYVVPTTATKQVVGSQGYSNSPLSQIGGLLAMLSSFGGQGGTTTGSSDGGGNLISSLLGLVGNSGSLGPTYDFTGGARPVGRANGGEVSPEAAYTDGQGNFYDVNGYLVG